MENIIIYTDGSYTDSDGVGYGYVIYHNNKIILSCYGHGADRNYYKHRNIYGEIYALVHALDYCVDNKIIPNYMDYKITIRCDYIGLIHWANKTWKRNNDLTKSYCAYIETLRKDGIQIEFEHVKGHQDDEGNCYADRLATKGRTKLTGENYRITKGVFHEIF